METYFDTNSKKVGTKMYLKEPAEELGHLLALCTYALVILKAQKQLQFLHKVSLFCYPAEVPLQSWWRPLWLLSALRFPAENRISRPTG